MNRYQTLGPRLLALIIDAIVFAPLVLLFMFVDDSETPDWAFYVLTPIFAVAGVAYNVLLHWRFGQTLGKMAMRVKVLSVAEEPISFGQACLRDVVYIIAKAVEVGATLYLLFAGFSWASDVVITTQQYINMPIFVWFVIDVIVCVKNKHNRALHDIIAGTVVVRLDVSKAGTKVEPPGPDAYDGLRPSAD